MMFHARSLRGDLVNTAKRADPHSKFELILPHGLPVPSQISRPISDLIALMIACATHTIPSIMRQ